MVLELHFQIAYESAVPYSFPFQISRMSVFGIVEQEPEKCKQTMLPLHFR